MTQRNASDILHLVIAVYHLLDLSIFIYTKTEINSNPCHERANMTRCDTRKASTSGRIPLHNAQDLGVFRYLENNVGLEGSTPLRSPSKSS